MTTVRQVISDLVIKGLSPWLYGDGCILGLHRVLPGDRRSPLALPRDLEVSEVFLRELLQGLRSRGTEFVTLDRLIGGLKRNGPRKRMAVTLDDGYLDNLEVALPVFEDLEIPFIVYVTTGLIDKTIDPWWYSLQTFVMEAGQVRIPGRSEAGVEEVSAETREGKERAYGRVYRRVREAGRGGSRFLRRFWEANRLAGAPETEGLFLSWEQLSRLASHPLATIGAHTVTHPRLSWLEPDEIRQELVAAGSRLETELGVSVTHVAYPHGGVEDVPLDISRLAREAGYHTGVMGVPRPVRRSDGDRPWTLPRVFIPGCDERFRVVERQISGFEAWRSPRLRETLRKLDALG